MKYPKYGFVVKTNKRRICEEFDRDFFSNDDDDDENSEVSSESNRLMFYSGVTKDNILKFNKEIQELDRYLVTLSSDFKLKTPADLFIHINSGGGNLFDGLAASDYIKQCESKTISVVEGYAASAATLMSVVANHRVIRKHSHMTIHQLSSGIWGTHREIIDEAENCNALMDEIKQIYKENTRIPKKTLDDILLHDLVLTPQKCLEWGLVDEIW